VNTAIVGQNNDASLSADFLTYTSNGFVKATYSPSANVNTAGATAVYDANSSGNGTNNNTLSAPASLYALNNAGQVITLNGQTLTLGNGSNINPAGVVLGGGQINGGTLAFRGSEATVYTSLAGGTISSAITGSNGLTKFGPGTLLLTGAESYTGDTMINLGALSFAGGSSLTNSGTIGTGDGGDNPTLIVNGGAVSVGTLNLYGHTTATVNIVSGSLSLTSSFNYTNAGVITQTGGTFSAGGYALSNGSALMPSTFYLGGGTATFSQTSWGSLVVGAPSNAGSIYVTRSGALTVNGDGTFNSNRGNGIRNNFAVGSNSSTGG
jgi:autotransporter-associated beta strand protein